MAKSKAAIAEEKRVKKIREEGNAGALSFFNKYIAGRRTKLKNKDNAKVRVENKTKTMSEKNATQMSKIAKNAKSVGSSQTDSQMSAKARKDAIAKLMKKVNNPTPKGVSQGSSASKSPKSSLGYPKVSQGSTTAKGKTGYPKVSQGSKTAAGKTGYPKVSQGSKTAAGKTGFPKVSQGSKTANKRGDIVTAAQLKKSGMSLRDYLNSKRGLTRRKETAKEAMLKRGKRSST